MTATEPQVPDVPYEILNEHDPLLAALGGLLRIAVKDFGCRASVAEYEPGSGLQPLTFSLKCPAKTPPSKVQTLVRAFRHDHGVSLKPTVEDRTVFFTVPANVIGVHGRVATYSNHECHDTLCRLAWARRAEHQKARRIEKLKANFDAYPHGNAYTYKNYGCKCRPCTDAWAASIAAHRASKRLAAAAK